MNQIEKCKVTCGLAGATTATAATAVTCIDTLGAPKVHIYVLNGRPTTSGVFSDIDVYHGTNSSGTTLIAAASWGTESSTSAANILPTDALGGLAGGIVEIHLDMRGRERYVNVLTTRGPSGSAATGGVFAIVEPAISADSASDKRMKNYGINTNYQAVGTVNA